MPGAIDLIKYEGDNSTFIWKHPCEDFTNLTQLVVHESQEAIFFMNGQIMDVFQAGRYTLQSQNIPKIEKVLSRNKDDNNPFHCEVYFINLVEQMSIRWGTNDKVQYIDANYKFPISIGASGEMSLSIENGKKLLLKLVGTESIISQSKLVDYFRFILNTKVKTYIAQYMKNNAVNIFEIDENLSIMSLSLKSLLVPDFLEYGINLEKFFITTIVKPDGEKQYEKFKELYFRKYADIEEANIEQQKGIIHADTEAKKMIIESKALSEKRKQEGYTYQQEKGFEVAKEIAANEAVGQMTNVGVGLGTMAGVGASVGGIVGNSIKGVLDQNSSEQSRICPNCGTSVETKFEFCPSCGNKIMDKCEKCGYVFEKPSKFCPNCGNKRSQL